jgi:serine/threonine protein kinase/WD40 repeat protein
MTPPAVHTFSDLLKRYHLLDAAQLAEVQQALLPRFSNAEALLGELLCRGWLTAYQAEQLALGERGLLVLGSYVLLDRLGEGGMGQVYRARNWKLGHVVALKLVRPERANNETVLRRFRREIQLASQLSHPHVVRALDADEIDGTCLLTMEYVEGTDLCRLVRSHGPLPVREACEYVRQAALGLQHAHECGLVHRDVKPHNLLLGSDGRVKLLDLGLARIHSGDAELMATLTQDGAVMGTPDFIAPEQARSSHSADSRSDLYSLGCTLYFLLTGKVPFGEGGVTGKLLRHYLDPVPDPRALRPEVPSAVSAVVQKLMAKAPDARYQTPVELADALAALLATEDLPAGDGTAVPATGPQTPSLPGNTWAGLGSASTAEETPGTGQRRRSRPRWLLQMATVCGIVIALAGLLTFVICHFWISGPVPETAEDGPATLAVEAAGGWQDTGVDLAEGDRFRVTTTGTWTKDGQSCGAAGLDEEPRDRVLVATAPLLALLGRIGDDPRPFLVPGEALRAPRAGRLYLRANDLDPNGNGGSLQATIGGGTRSKQRPPEPEPCLAEAAEEAWREIRPQSDDPAALLDFRRRYPGAPQMGRANAALAVVRARLPGPFDQLNRETIPADQRPTAQAAGDPETIERLVAVHGDGRLRHWDTIVAVLFSPDCRTLATSGAVDGTVVLWNSTSGRELFRLRPTVGPRPVPEAFTPDSRYLAVVGGGPAIEVWDIREMKLLYRKDCGQGAVSGAAVSHDGKRLVTAGKDGTIKTWETTSGRQEQVWKIGTKAIYHMAFGPTDKVLAFGGEEGKAGLLDPATGKTAGDFPAANVGPVNQVALSPDGKTLAVGSASIPVRLWDTDKHTSRDLPNGTAGRMSFLSDGSILVVHHLTTVQLWNVANTTLVRTLAVGAPASSEVSCASDGKTLAFAVANEVRLWDVAKATAGDVPLVPKRSAALEALAVSDDGRLIATADTAKGIAVREVATGKVLRTWSDYVNSVHRFGLVFGPEGQVLYSRGSPIKGRDPATGQQRQTFAPPGGGAVLTLTPDGKTLVCGGSNGRVEFLDAATGKGLRTLTLPRGINDVQCVSLTPDGTILGAVRSTGSGSTVFDLLTGREIHYTGLDKAACDWLTFSPDGRSLAISGTGPTRLISTATGKELLTLPAALGTVAFRPDGKVLALARLASPHLVDLYDMATGKVIETLMVGPPGGNVRPSFSPDSRHLLTMNSNGTLYVLRLAPPTK